MPEKSDEQISLFVRDEKTGRYLFNAEALQALGIDPAKVHERGFPTSSNRSFRSSALNAATR